MSNASAISARSDIVGSCWNDREKRRSRYRIETQGVSWVIGRWSGSAWITITFLGTGSYTGTSGSADSIHLHNLMLLLLRQSVRHRNELAPAANLTGYGKNPPPGIRSLWPQRRAHASLRINPASRDHIDVTNKSNDRFPQPDRGVRAETTLCRSIRLGSSSWSPFKIQADNATFSNLAFRPRSIFLSRYQFFGECFYEKQLLEARKSEETFTRFMKKRPAHLTGRRRALSRKFSHLATQAVIAHIAFALPAN